MEIFSTETTTGIVEIQKSLDTSEREIEKQLSILNDINKLISDEHQKQAKMKKTSSTIDHNVYKILDDLMTSEEQQKELDTEIISLSTDNACLQNQLSTIKRELVEETQKINEYDEKMHQSMAVYKQYQESHFENEKTENLLKELMNLQKENKEVEQQVMAREAERNNSEKELRELEETISELKNRVKVINSQIEDTKMQQKSKNQRIAVLHKRNEAQLTRLQRQMAACSQQVKRAFNE